MLWGPTCRRTTSKTPVYWDRLSDHYRLTGGPARSLSEGQSYPSSKEREPDDAKDQYRKAGTNQQQRQHRRAGFRLACFSGCFDDYTVLFNRHDAIAQILGAKPARSNTGTFSTSSGAAPDGVFSAARRNASVVASSPSTVSLAALPELCGRAGTCWPASVGLGSRLSCGIWVSLSRPIRKWTNPLPRIAFHRLYENQPRNAAGFYVGELRQHPLRFHSDII